ncbi:hypothetical protein HAX54_018115 [Datura stramonium]|uniref:Reverse transcriptase domain-containing protein n=1 Tax=Datura stramonium TaxID=4076 RepID=A0ABS8ULY1_DATST|nr:hypothetical protein [Datura stramonium]
MAISLRSGKDLSVTPPPYEENIALPEAEQEHSRKIVLKENKKAPLILGRPFLATRGSIIDVRSGKLKMRVLEEEATFNVSKAISTPSHYKDLCMIIEVFHDMCGLEKEETEKLCGEVIAMSKVKLLIFSMLVEHELNGGEVEKKRRIKEFEKTQRRRRKRLRVP